VYLPRGVANLFGNSLDGLYQKYMICTRVGAIATKWSLQLSINYVVINDKFTPTPFHAIYRLKWNAIHNHWFAILVIVSYFCFD
jgi:hypothetical protein